MTKVQPNSEEGRSDLINNHAELTRDITTFDQRQWRSRIGHQLNTLEIPRKRVQATDDVGQFAGNEQFIQKRTERRFVDDIEKSRSLEMMRSTRAAMAGPVQSTEQFTTDRSTEEFEQRIHRSIDRKTILHNRETRTNQMPMITTAANTPARWNGCGRNVVTSATTNRAHNEKERVDWTDTLSRVGSAATHSGATGEWRNGEMANGGEAASNGGG